MPSFSVVVWEQVCVGCNGLGNNLLPLIAGLRHIGTTNNVLPKFILIYISKNIIFFLV